MEEEIMSEEEPKYIKRRKSSYKVSMRNYVDSDYKEAVPIGVDGKPVEGLRLDDDQKEFMYRFENGYYGNNHRKEELFTDHPDYDVRLRKIADDITNSANRDMFTKDRISTIREDDIAHYIADSYNPELKDFLKANGLEKTVVHLIDCSAHDVIYHKNDIEEIKSILRTLSIHLVKALNLEKTYRRKQRRK